MGSGVTNEIAKQMMRDPIDMQYQIAELKHILKDARAKLVCYRAEHSGEYVGGMEYSSLLRRIDEALDK